MTKWLNWIYLSFHVQSIIVIGVLLLRNSQLTIWRFLTANALCLAMTAVIFPLFPAEGTYVHFGITPAALPGSTGTEAPWHFAHALRLLKSGYRHIDDQVLSGLVSFPSYHTMAAVLFTWAVWKTPVRWPLAALNCAMVMATPVIGAHYFIDLIGGVGVAVVAIRLACTWVDEPDTVSQSCRTN